MALFNKNTSELNEEATDFHFPTSKKALIIFTRNPELGKCKTRLATVIGDKAALEIYRMLLEHTAEVTKNIKADRFVLYSDSITKNDVWDDTLFIKKLQIGEDLGIRMQNAFIDRFESGYEKVVIVGSDIFDLTQNHIEEAFQKLNEHDVVIGPAKDGGYYLLGLKTLPDNLFSNKNWGTSTVLKNTLDDLESYNVHLLEELNDIDTFDDIKNLSEFKKFI